MSAAYRSLRLPYRVVWHVSCALASVALAGVGAPAARGQNGATLARAPIASVLLARGRTEPALALVPQHNDIIAAANPDYYDDRSPEARNVPFVSFDGGATWARPAVPALPPYTGIADPSLGVDGSGRIYYLYMGETPSYCSESGNVALLLARSFDGGQSFGAPRVVDIDPPDDKPFIAVETQAGQTHVYVTFTRWRSPRRQIMFTRSLDGGQTFSPPVLLYTSPGVNMGSLPLAGPHGLLYVLWAHYDSTSFYVPLKVRIMLRVSRDGGRTFGPPLTVAAFTGLPRLLSPGALRIFTFPTAGVDPRTGTLYVAWTAARPMLRPLYSGEMDADLMLSRSRDEGRTWTRPVALNETPDGDRFMPALSVGPDGIIRVAFYDRRVDHLRFGLYGIAARDLGSSLRIWPSRRLSPALSSPLLLHYIAPGSTCVAPGRFMGDYISAVTARDGTFDVAWTDTARGVPAETDLWFARVAPAVLLAGMPRIVPLSTISPAVMGATQSPGRVVSTRGRAVRSSTHPRSDHERRSARAGSLHS